jgi:uncharacterized membrane protein YfcA
MSTDDSLLTTAIGVTALLYAAVGQAGATGYLAWFALFAMAAPAMKVSALALNVVVSAIGTVQFSRAGLVDWRSAAPFCMAGVPCAFVGGALYLPGSIYGPLIGGLLLLTAAQMVWQLIGKARAVLPYRAPRLPPALLSGAIVGFASGLTGAGGGIFLAPILARLRWYEVRRAAGITATYNLIGSLAGLAGSLSTEGQFASALPVWMIAAAVGGVIGSTLGARFLPPKAMRMILASILVIAGSRLLIG